MTRRQKRPYVRLQSRAQQIFLSLFVITVSFWIFLLFFTLPMQINQWRISSLEILLYSPGYLSANEENIIRIALENTDEHAVNATVRLINDGQTASFFGAETNTFYSGIVESKEQISRELLIFIPFTEGILGNAIDMSLQGKIEDVSWNEKLQIRVAPLPKIRSIAKYLNGLFLTVFGSAMGLIIEAFRPSLQSFRKKK